MGKLGSKEIFLILIIINFLLYYLAYMCVINPLRKQGQELKSEKTTLETTYNDNKQVVDSKQQYLDDIERIKGEKATLFAESFPDAETENLHAYMVDQAKASGITIDSINLAQNVSTVHNDETGEDEPTGLKTNTISVNITGTYANIIKLITDIENVKKTSLLTSLSLSGGASQMTASVNYSLLSVDKGEDIQDPTFDHTFGQATGDTVLFK